MIAEGLIASLLRGQVPPFDAAQLRAEFVAQARSKDATRHAGALGLAAMASEPYKVPTWLLDVAQALAQHSSVSAATAQEFFRTRGRAIDELGVTRHQPLPAAQTLIACRFAPTRSRRR